jgi:DNA adenine methylase
MGSKSKLLDSVWGAVQNLDIDTVTDLFSGSGVVSYLFKSQGKRVISNDHMAMASCYSLAMIENNNVLLPLDVAESLTIPNGNTDLFVATTFKDIYFSDEDNAFIDTVRANAKLLKNKYQKAIAISALIRACVKKRPRGIFTYVGQRYNDGRKDLSKTFYEQFLDAVRSINEAVFDNGHQNIALNEDAFSVSHSSDLVYLDPPYFSLLSDNQYVRRYHFVEGIARDWKGVEIQEHTITKKFKSYDTPFSTKKGTYDAFDRIFEKYRESKILVSYSSNSLPTMDEMIELLSRYKADVKVIEVDHTYSFGNQGHKVNDNKNKIQEYLFLAV